MLLDLGICAQAASNSGPADGTLDSALLVAVPRHSAGTLAELVTVFEVHFPRND